jgi:hypothetical protein
MRLAASKEINAAGAAREWSFKQIPSLGFLCDLCG